MSFPSYHVKNTDKRVKIYINGQPVSNSTMQHEHARYINFVGDQVPLIEENDIHRTFDIHLYDFIKKVIKEEEKNK